MHISLKTAGRAGLLALAAITATACGEPAPESTPGAAPRAAGTIYTVRDTTVRATFEAAGTAAPLQQATLSTKVMGTITAVLVHEGDRVRAGQLLARIDARELGAKAAQVSAGVAEAEAMHRDAVTQAGRIRALYADSAATRAQLDAAETGLARAAAGLRAARAASAELGAVSSYAEVRAPFTGIVTRRWVDAGAFAAPGAPFLTVQDASQLRVSVSAAPDAVAGLRAGQPIDVVIEGRPARATIEGVVPAVAGNLYTVNARVANADGALLAGSTATIALPLGERVTLVVPARAVSRDGDLTGVTLRTPQGDVTRWVRLGRAAGDVIEVSAGLRAGDQVVVPAAPAVVAGRS